MYRLFRVLPAGVALFLAACSDGTGPPEQSLINQEPTLGSVVGEGVDGSTLHRLRQGAKIATGQRQFLLADGAPASSMQASPDVYEVKFWAVRGKESKVTLDYEADSTGNTRPLLRFSIPKDGLKLRPDGHKFEKQDSVLVTLRISRSNFFVDFGPSGLVFNDHNPANLEIWYTGAADPVPVNLLNLWYQQDDGELWYQITSRHDTELKWFETNLFHFSNYAISW